MGGQVTNPDGGTVEITQDDTYNGKITQEKVMIRLDNPPIYRTTTFDYDASLNLTAETVDAGGLNLTTTYTYDDQGNRTSITNPTGVTVIEAAYNQYGGPEVIRGPEVLVEDGTGNLVPGRSEIQVEYDPSTFMPLDITDGLGYVGGYARWNSQGNPEIQKDGEKNETEFVYDAYGKVREVHEPSGRIVKYEYDLMGNRIWRIEPCETDPQGCITYYEYDALNRLEQITDPLGTITRYEYDANGNRTVSGQYLRQGGELVELTRTEYQYDALNRLTDVTHPDGTVTHYEYDWMGHQVKVITNFVDGDYDETRPDEDLIREMKYDPAGQLETEKNVSCCGISGNTTTYAYDAAGRVETTTSQGVTTKYIYDAIGRLEEEQDSLERSIVYTYNDADQLTEVEDREGNVTQYRYDVRGRVVRVIYPDGSEVAYSYDLAGRQTDTIELNGTVTHQVYNAAGQLIQVIQAQGMPDESVTRYVYDSTTGLLTQTIDPLSRKTYYQYDALGRQVRVTNNYDDGLFDPVHPDQDLSQTLVYDALGRLTDVTDANGTVTHYEYDELGQLIQTVINYVDGVYDPNHSDEDLIQKVEYDGVGRQTAITDPNGKTTAYSYDSLGRLYQVINPMGQATTYLYDTHGRLESIIDANSHPIQFEYDPLTGRLDRKIWPDGSDEQFFYDANGNLTSHQLTDGNTNSFFYNNMNRLETASYFDGQAIAYTYTDSGQVENVQDARGSVTYTYDSLDRPESVTYGGQSISYKHDAAGNRTEMITPAGRIDYVYDDMDRLKTVTAGSDTTNLSYDPVGLLTQITRPNGVISTTSYDGAYRPETIIHSHNGTTLGSFSYTYDAAGNRLSVTELDGTLIEWAYDDAYRLERETRSGSETAYTYDATGNRLSMTQSGITTYYVYNTLDQLRCTRTSQGSDCLTDVLTQYTYDGRGNLDTETTGGITTYYTFDARDLLTGVDDGTNSLTYTHDAGGRRISEYLNGAVTTYRWDEFSPYGDIVYETNGTQTTSYALAGSHLLSQTVDGTTSYFLQDAQGSTRALTDTLGSVTDTYAYNAFGDLHAQTGTTANPYLYTGQRYDAATEQYYLRAREYDPVVGRFLSRDTWAVDTWHPVELNRYVYAAANPATWADPTGQMAEAAAINMQVATVDIPALLIYSAALTCVLYFQTISLMQFAGMDTTLIRAAAPDGCESRRTCATVHPGKKICDARKDFNTMWLACGAVAKEVNLRLAVSGLDGEVNATNFVVSNRNFPTCGTCTRYSYTEHGQIGRKQDGTHFNLYATREAWEASKEPCAAVWYLECCEENNGNPRLVNRYRVEKIRPECAQ